MKINFTNVPLFIKRGLSKLIMRAFIFLLCTASFGFSTKPVLSQNVDISLSSDRTVTIKQVFDLIKVQTDYKFIYRSDLLANVEPIELKKGKIKVRELLDKCLSPANFTYRFRGNNTVIVKRDVEQVSPLKQEISVSGVVTDETGEGLAGVNIVIKGTRQGTITDVDGAYNLDVPEGATLIVSFIGMATQEVEVGSRSVIDLVMRLDAKNLSEVVVIGYQSQRAEEVTSAIGSVKSKEIAKVMVGNTSFDRSLAGLLKGVNVTSGDGSPGGNVSINIRGYTSPFTGGDSNPLWVIDGVSYVINPTSYRDDETRLAEPFNPLLSINPNDIERMDVLKDAAATSIYGSRGANGVIIVTTKKGKRNTKPTVSWSSSISVSKPIGQEEFLNTTEWKQHLDTYFKNSPEIVSGEKLIGNDHQHINAMILRNPDDTYKGLNDAGFGEGTTDWADVLSNDHATTKTHNFAIRGGNESTTYSASIGFTDKDGLSLRDDLKQYNLRLNLDSKISKMFETGFNLNVSYSKSERGGSSSPDGSSGTDVGDVASTSQRPDRPHLDANGDPILRITTLWDDGNIIFAVHNPTDYANLVSTDDQRRAYNVTGNTYLKVNVNENISVKAALSSGVYVTDASTYTPASILGVSYGFPEERFSENTSAFSTRTGSRVLNTNVTTDLTANYSNTFGKHTVNGLIGYSWLKDRGDRTRTLLEGFPDDVTLTNPSNAHIKTTYDAAVIESGLNSLIGRATYNYDSKYFVTASVRTDKSSKFGPGDETGVFPAISASWNITKESFLNGSDFIDLLSLRVGRGTTGSNNIRDFAYLQGFETARFDKALYNGVSAIGLKNQLANEDVAWEETKELNVGLDFGFLNNRIRGSIDFYDKQTEGALIATPIPVESGLTIFTSNFADLSNKGFEFELAGDIIVKDDLKWSASFNIAQNKNKVESLPTSFVADPESRFVVGREVGLIRGFQIEGIYKDQQQIDDGVPLASGSSQVGDYIIADDNEDGKIDEDDRNVILGSGQADYFGGFSSDLSYKGFTLSVLFNYSIGGEVVDGEYEPKDIARVGLSNVLKRYSGDHRWSEDNPGAKFPRIGEGGNGDLLNYRTDSRRVYDKTYLRLRNVQLAYNLPKNVISNIGLSQASVFVSASNLFTWFKEFPGVDVENGIARVGALSADRSQVAGGSYVNGKAWSFGINLNF